VKRKSLSGNLLVEKTAFFILIALILIFCIKHYPEVLIIAIPAFIAIDYLIYHLPDTIDYDDNNIFIKRKKGELVVPLKDICLVKVTWLSIGHRNIWKIKYVNCNIEGIVLFYPRYFSSSFDDFIKQVKTNNPKAEF
jgi:hypothetical protein